MTACSLIRVFSGGVILVFITGLIIGRLLKLNDLEEKKED